MAQRAAAISWRALRRHSRLGFCGRCYSTASPFPLDPLVADVVRESTPSGHAREAVRPGYTARQVAKLSTLSEPIDQEKAALPPIEEWRKFFPNNALSNHRISIRNPDSAAAIAEAFVPTGSRGKVIIEAFPGPGQLTRALLNLPKERIRKLIVLENNPLYLDYIRPLEGLDPRITVLPIEGYEWDSYQVIEQMGLLSDVPKIEWSAGIHPQLHFISHIPSTIIGEQLVAQFFRSIPEKQWLFQYGRMPLSFVLSEHVWKRISAKTTDKSVRCKVSVIAEAVAECTEALPFESLQPFEDHFHPARPLPSNYQKERDGKFNSRRVGNPFQVINVLPLEHQVISKGMLDKWDFCLRRLFVRKATPIQKGLVSLAPGAQTLVKKITDSNLPPSEQVDVKKTIIQLTVRDWAIILKAFDEWPFAPENLSIDDSFVIKDPR